MQPSTRYRQNQKSFVPSKQNSPATLRVSAGATSAAGEHPRILLAVTGGIACYKAAQLTREFIRRGAEVQVLMTPGAERFVSALTFQALSGRSVRTDLFDNESEAAMDHIELARWGQALVVAPATANAIARLAHGLAGDIVATTALCHRGPLILAPAMNPRMWSHEATRDNVDKLKHRGALLLGPASGEHACGDDGEGRMLEPEEIAKSVFAALAGGTPEKRPQRQLDRVKVLVTAGPTRERIDPARYLSNFSSGKMGVAVAVAAAAAGAQVTLIAGPINLHVPGNIKRIDIESATEMHREVQALVESADIFIGVAAVCDFRPQKQNREKTPKNQTRTLPLEANPDILSKVAAHPHAPFTVGFAAETAADGEQRARQKMAEKNIDMIALNRIDGSHPFGSDDNALSILWPGGSFDTGRHGKERVARELIALTAERWRRQRDGGARSGAAPKASSLALQKRS